MSDSLPRKADPNAAHTVDHTVDQTADHTAAQSQPGLRATVTYLADEGDQQALGMRVVEPPREAKQAVRGSLYAVVDLSGNSPERARVTERALSMLQRTYYTVRGSMSAVLSEALRNAHHVVREFNEAHPEEPLRVSIACATLLARRMMVACSGAAFMVVRNGEIVELYPTEPAQLRPLNPAEVREVEVLKWEMNPGDVVLLAGPAWAKAVPLKTLAATVYYLEEEMGDEAAAGLREQGHNPSAPGLLLVLQSDAPATPLSPARSATPLTGGRRSTPGALPTSLSATPPVTSPAALTPRPGEESQPADAPSARQEPAPQEIFPQPVVRAAEPVSNEPTRIEDDGAPSAPEPAPVDPHSLAPTTADRVRSGALESLGKARTFLGRMLPDKRDAAPEGFELLDNDESLGASYAERVAGGPVQSAADAGDDPFAANPFAADPDVLKPQPFRPPAPSSGNRARLFLTLALALALLVPVVVIGVNISRGPSIRAEAENLIQMAQSRLFSAGEAFDQDKKRDTLNLLSEAEDLLDRAVELVGASAPSNELRAEIRRLEQEAADVQPLYELMSPLVTFPIGSAPTRVLVQDQDIYVLDPGRALIARYRMDQSMEQVPDEVGASILKTGDVVQGVEVGELLDMTWQPVIPGRDDKATLLVLDATNRVWRYDPRVEGPTLLTLEGADSFQRVRQVESYNGRLYLADVGMGQMLRYPQGQYDVLPSPWFRQPISLDDMQSLRIDGEVWLLLNNGQVLRFFDGEQQAFSLDNSVGLVRDAVDFVVGDGTNPFIYVADGGGERVWIYNKEGVYVRQFAAPEGNPLRGLSGIFIEEATDSLYLLTSTALFKHGLPPSDTAAD